MKKIASLLRRLMVVMFLFVLGMGPSVRANDSEIYQASDEKSPISQIVFQNDQIYLTINGESDQAHETILFLSKFIETTVGMPNPETENVGQVSKDLGLDYGTVSADIELEEDSSVYAVISQLQEATPGIYTEVDGMGQLVFMISQAEKTEKEDSLDIKLFEETLLSLGRKDEKTLTYEGYDFNLK
ncbi:hypothetical protein HZY91_02890 [Facklamia sp. DSM 111018]|uniref:GerMN domain-containing protein n=1 Tax=Facklamia lactis TaxID=2749967 RepID=A0ABS0LP01_9LACT|nr:hypothetical protein [Facklamia lactis]MBG9985837.1 hypothetical protein [Facklamia lactis]